MRTLQGRVAAVGRDWASGRKGRGSGDEWKPRSIPGDTPCTLPLPWEAQAVSDGHWGFVCFKENSQAHVPVGCFELIVSHQSPAALKDQELPEPRCTFRRPGSELSGWPLPRRHGPQAPPLPLVSLGLTFRRCVHAGLAARLLSGIDSTI